MKKGFTLVELLAVIIVLGIVSIITVNVVTNNIETTKKKTFEVNAISLLEAAKEYVTKEMEDNDFPEEGIEAKKLNMKNNPFISGIVKRNEQDQIILENVTDGKYCVNGVRSKLKITEGSCDSEDDTAPMLRIKELTRETTSTEFLLLINTKDTGSGIDYYEYCVEENCIEPIKIDKKGIKEEIKDVVKIDKLNKNEEYVVRVKAVDKKGNKTEKKISVKTKEIDAPTFKISSSTHATTKELIITYPDVEEGYEKGYVITRHEEENKEETVTLEDNKREIKLEIKATISLVAYIKKGTQIVVSNSIKVIGIDKEAPIVDVMIDEPDKWTKKKTVTINAVDYGVGLALRPYSYDGGETWVKENTREYTSPTILDIKVRDRLGNIRDKSCLIEKIDKEAPNIEMKVISGTKIQSQNYKDWYNSEVQLQISVQDYYKKDNEKIPGGSGINDKTLIIKENNILLKDLDIKNGNGIISTTIILSQSKENKIYVEVQDNSENKSTKTETIKIDNVDPTISVKNGTLKLSKADYKFINNVTTKYGPTGGMTTCSPGDSLKSGTYTVTCTATGTNGKDNSTSFTVLHDYLGTPTCPNDGTYNEETKKCDYTKNLEVCGCKTFKKCATAACGTTSCCKKYVDGQCCNGDCNCYAPDGSFNCWGQCGTTNVQPGKQCCVRCGGGTTYSCSQCADWGTCNKTCEHKKCGCKTADSCSKEPTYICSESNSYIGDGSIERPDKQTCYFN